MAINDIRKFKKFKYNAEVNAIISLIQENNDINKIKILEKFYKLLQEIYISDNIILIISAMGEKCIVDPYYKSTLETIIFESFKCAYKRKRVSVTEALVVLCFEYGSEEPLIKFVKNINVNIQTYNVIIDNINKYENFNNDKKRKICLILLSKILDDIKKYEKYFRNNIHRINIRLEYFKVFSDFYKSNIRNAFLNDDHDLLDVCFKLIVGILTVNFHSFNEEHIIKKNFNKFQKTIILIFKYYDKHFIDDENLKENIQSKLLMWLMHIAFKNDKFEYVRLYFSQKNIIEEDYYKILEMAYNSKQYPYLTIKEIFANIHKLVDIENNLADGNKYLKEIRNIIFNAIRDSDVKMLMLILESIKINPIMLDFSKYSDNELIDKKPLLCKNKKENAHKFSLLVMVGRMMPVNYEVLFCVVCCYAKIYHHDEECKQIIELQFKLLRAVLGPEKYNKMCSYSIQENDLVYPAVPVQESKNVVLEVRKYEELSIKRYENNRDMVNVGSVGGCSK